MERGDQTVDRHQSPTTCQWWSLPLASPASVLRQHGVDPTASDEQPGIMVGLAGASASVVPCTFATLLSLIVLQMVDSAQKLHMGRNIKDIFMASIRPVSGMPWSVLSGCQ